MARSRAFVPRIKRHRVALSQTRGTSIVTIVTTRTADGIVATTMRAVNLQNRLRFARAKAFRRLLDG